jgi:hypothetical protein
LSLLYLVSGKLADDVEESGKLRKAKNRLVVASIELLV